MTMTTYSSAQALAALGISRRRLNRLATAGLLSEDEQPVEKIIALAAVAEVLAESDVQLADDDVASIVDEVVGVLREHPSGRDVILRVTGDVYEVAPFERLGPLPPPRRGVVVHEVSLESFVSGARRVTSG